jgi:DNA repair exonuclease SbcCD ATPase subunit
MRLLSITVRSYRLHREVKVELDPARTLIGGPNECGKSTLIEAAHRALFLRAKTTGEAQKSMISRNHGGQPEVEVCFEAGGRGYRLLKRFTGLNGTATLTESGGPTWSGDEAETRLAELLGVGAVGGGRGAGDRAAQQWAHLWVWQGRAGDDPTEHANAQCAALLARLQGEGGAAAMQSESDARVARGLAQRNESLFNRNGDPKAGSELAGAIAAEAAAATALAAAQQTLSQLEQAVFDFHESEQTIQVSEAALSQLRREQSVVEAHLTRVAALRGEEQAQALNAANATEKHQTLLQADARIRELRQAVEDQAAALLPKEASTRSLSEEEAECRQRDIGADQEWQQAVSKVHFVRLRSDLAGAHLQRIEKANQLHQVEKRLVQVHELRNTLGLLEAGLAQIPLVTAPKLKMLQKIDGECSNAGAALEAMAAGLEVIASDAVVRVGCQTVATGESQILTEDTEVTIGPAIHLRIRPGGGTSLVRARQRLHDVRATLQQNLDAFGIRSVAEAAEAAARRQQLEADIQTAKARLESLGADTIEDDFARARNAFAAAESEAERRAAFVTNFFVPAAVKEAEAMVSEAGRQLREAEANESSARAARNTSAANLRRASERLAGHRQGLHDQKRILADLEAQLRLLIETQGDDANRKQLLAEFFARRLAAERLLADTRRSLAELQPELLEGDRIRCQRAILQHTAAKTEAGQKRAVARSEFERDGTSDPRADLAIAEAQMRNACEHRTRAARKAGAIRLLHQLFLGEQRALAEQFTDPLAAKISSYLECLFGAGARAVVSLEDNAFRGLRVIRPAHGPGALDFANLSGGLREQVAAAVRLAMAEVLAAGHDGCLPLVFDDAFAYSDPERVQILQRMLDHGAVRGLQIVVLTCNPSVYGNLGAKLVTLCVERDPTPLPAENEPLNAGDSETEGKEGPESPAEITATVEQRQTLMALD